jgi:PPK2 family polyphosphate:nucleotide phosphotransferase
MIAMATSVTTSLRLQPGPVDLGDYDPRATPGFSKGKTKGKDALLKLAPRVEDLQERLFAESRTGGERRVLLVLQGMDTSGKGGVMRHCVGLLDPQGVVITSFKAPTATERRHDFLWRIARRTPGPGMIGIFDRSHYEDVLVARVHKLSPAAEIRRRYQAINRFERELVDGSTTVVKCFLHVSKDEQKSRLLARLDDPTKHWKYNPHDVDERQRWDDYQQAYAVALEKCNTEAAPWYVVPSDRKWYRNFAITRLLLEHLERLDPKWPQGSFDVEAERVRVAAT